MIARGKVIFPDWSVELLKKNMLWFQNRQNLRKISDKIV